MTAMLLASPFRKPLCGDAAMYEVIDGERVEVAPMSIYSNHVAALLMLELGLFARDNRLGRVYVEALFEIPSPREPRRRRPDVAYVSFARWPHDRPLPAREAAWAVAPDLAVEVTSPTDLIDDLGQKLRDYFAAGVRRVWVIDPLARTLTDYWSPTQMRGFGEADRVDGADVLPGFAAVLGDLLGPPAVDEG